MSPGIFAALFSLHFVHILTFSPEMKSTRPALEVRDHILLITVLSPANQDLPEIAASQPIDSVGPRTIIVSVLKVDDVQQAEFRYV